MTDLELAAPNLVAPVADAAALVENQRAYRALCAALLDEDDFQSYADRGGVTRSFKKKSAWRKLNVAFNVTTELLATDLDRDDDGRLLRATVTARATAPNGRYADGIGVCDRAERTFTKPEHDILATAHTRATNRASSDLYGMGEVSAEEIDDTPITAASREQSRRQDQSGRHRGQPSGRPMTREEVDEARRLASSGRYRGATAPIPAASARTPTPPAGDQRADPGEGSAKVDPAVDAPSAGSTEPVPDHVHDDSPESRGLGVEHAYRYEDPRDPGRPFE
jgi:hypothetical protein